jgi:hypothetical protein
LLTDAGGAKAEATLRAVRTRATDVFMLLFYFLGMNENPKLQLGSPLAGRGD